MDSRGTLEKSSWMNLDLQMCMATGKYFGKENRFIRRKDDFFGYIKCTSWAVEDDLLKYF